MNNRPSKKEKAKKRSKKHFVKKASKGKAIRYTAKTVHVETSKIVADYHR